MNFQLRDETTGSYLLTGTSEAHPYKDMAALYDICNNLEFNYEFGRGTHWLGEEGLDYRYTNKSHIAQGWHNELIVELTNLMRLLTPIKVDMSLIWLKKNFRKMKVKDSII